MTSRWISAGLVSLALAACGGGGGDAPPGGGNPPAAVTATWEALPTAGGRAAFLQQLNAQGQRGYAYYAPTAFGLSAVDLRELYVRDTATTYTYELLDMPATPADLLAQMNAQGARRFALYGPLTVGMVYVRDDSRGTTFTHQLLPLQTTNDTFLAQANVQGAAGAFFGGPIGFAAPAASFAIYTRESNRAASYTYSLEPAVDDPGTPEDLLAQANSRGQQGHLFHGSFFFPGEPAGDARRFRNLYVKDTRQASRFSWKALAPASSASAFVAQANDEGLRGSLFWSAFAFFPGGSSTGPVVERNLFVTPGACAGPLCSPSSPL